MALAMLLSNLLPLCAFTLLAVHLAGTAATSPSVFELPCAPLLIDNFTLWTINATNSSSNNNNSPHERYELNCDATSGLPPSFNGTMRIVVDVRQQCDSDSAGVKWDVAVAVLGVPTNAALSILVMGDSHNCSSSNRVNLTVLFGTPLFVAPAAPFPLVIVDGAVGGHVAVVCNSTVEITSGPPLLRVDIVPIGGLSIVFLSNSSVRCINAPTAVVLPLQSATANFSGGSLEFIASLSVITFLSDGAIGSSFITFSSSPAPSSALSVTTPSLLLSILFSNCSIVVDCGASPCGIVLHLERVSSIVPISFTMTDCRGVTLTNGALVLAYFYLPAQLRQVVAANVDVLLANSTVSLTVTASPLSLLTIKGLYSIVTVANITFTAVDVTLEVRGSRFGGIAHFEALYNYGELSGSNVKIALANVSVDWTASTAGSAVVSFHGLNAATLNDASLTIWNSSLQQRNIDPNVVQSVLFRLSSSGGDVAAAAIEMVIVDTVVVLVATTDLSLWECYSLNSDIVQLHDVLIIVLRSELTLLAVDTSRVALIAANDASVRSMSNLTIHLISSTMNATNHRVINVLAAYDINVNGIRVAVHDTAMELQLDCALIELYANLTATVGGDLNTVNVSVVVERSRIHSWGGEMFMAIRHGAFLNITSESTSAVFIGSAITIGSKFGANFAAFDSFFGDSLVVNNLSISLIDTVMRFVNLTLEFMYASAHQGGLRLERTLITVLQSSIVLVQGGMSSGVMVSIDLPANNNVTIVDMTALIGNSSLTLDLIQAFLLHVHGGLQLLCANITLVISDASHIVGVSGIRVISRTTNISTALRLSIVGGSTMLVAWRGGGASLVECSAVDVMQIDSVAVVVQGASSVRLPAGTVVAIIAGTGLTVSPTNISVSISNWSMIDLLSLFDVVDPSSLIKVVGSGFVRVGVELSNRSAACLCAGGSLILRNSPASSGTQVSSPITVAVTLAGRSSLVFACNAQISIASGWVLIAPNATSAQVRLTLHRSDVVLAGYSALNSTTNGSALRLPDAVTFNVSSPFRESVVVICSRLLTVGSIPNTSVAALRLGSLTSTRMLAAGDFPSDSAELNVEGCSWSPSFSGDSLSMSKNLSASLGNASNSPSSCATNSASTTIGRRSASMSTTNDTSNTFSNQRTNSPTSGDAGGSTTFSRLLAASTSKTGTRSPPISCTVVPSATLVTCGVPSTDSLSQSASLFAHHAIAVGRSELLGGKLLVAVAVVAAASAGLTIITAGASIGLSLLQCIVQQSSRVAQCAQQHIGPQDVPALVPMSDLIDNPFQFHIDALGNEMAFVGGALVGNFALFGVLCFLRLVASFADSGRCPPSITLWSKCMPGNLVGPLVAVVQPIVTASIALCWASSRAPASIVLASLSLLSCVSFFSYVWWTRATSPQRAQILEVPAAFRSTGRLLWFEYLRRWFTPTHRFKSSCPESDCFLARYGDVISPYRHHRQWFAYIEVGVIMVLAIAGGVSIGLPADALCGHLQTALLGVQLIASGALMISAAAFIPHTVRADSVVSAVGGVLSCVAFALMLAEIDNEIVNDVVLAQVAFMLAGALPQFVITLVADRFCIITPLEPLVTFDNGKDSLTTMSTTLNRNVSAALSRCCNNENSLEYHLRDNLRQLIVAICAARHNSKLSTI